MLAGEAVFVHDSEGAENHIGQSTFTSPNLDETLLEVDFVQELLNQVVPHKRSLSESYSFGPSNDEPLLEENGWFNDNTSKALRIFRESFRMGGIKTNPDDSSDTYRIGNTLASFSWASGSIQYDASDDTTDTFRKLMKDYEHDSNPIITASYLHTVIDKEILVGRTNNTGDNPDVIINGREIPASSGQIA